MRSALTLALAALALGTGCSKVSLPAVPEAADRTSRVLAGESDQRVFVTAGLEASRVLIFGTHSSALLQTIRFSQTLSGLAYVDAFGRLFVGPFAAGAPVLDVLPPYREPPTAVHVPPSFSVDGILDRQGLGPLLIAVSQPARSEILVYRTPSDANAIGVLSIPDEMGIRSWSLNAKGTLFLSLCCRRGRGAVVAAYSPPYGSPRFLRQSATPPALFSGPRDRLIMFVATGKGNRVFRLEPPYRLPATQVLALPKGDRMVALGSKGQIFTLVASTKRPRIEIYDPPYATISDRIDLTAVTGSVSEVLLDVNDDIFVVTQDSVAREGHLKQRFGVWEARVPYRGFSWQTGMRDDPSNEPPNVAVFPPAQF